jgi:hypothetical protein
MLMTTMMLLVLCMNHLKMSTLELRKFGMPSLSKMNRNFLKEALKHEKEKTMRDKALEEKNLSEDHRRRTILKILEARVTGTSILRDFYSRFFK